MGKNLFSVPIFFVVFRETLEAAIIISVLLALVEQLVEPKEHTDLTSPPGFLQHHKKNSTSPEGSDVGGEDEEGHIRAASHKKLLRKLRLQIAFGAGCGLFIALAIGAAFIAVFYTQVDNDLYAKSEDLWEGIFSLIAAIMIWGMGVTMLRMDRAKIKWRIKLQNAFANNKDIVSINGDKIKQSRSSKWALFVLPFVTVLREGLEAVVFVGGVSMGQQATSIPIAAIVGLITGLVIGFILYKSSSRLNLSIFLVASTIFLLFIGAGLFSRCVGYFQTHAFTLLAGSAAAESGNGPGSFNVHGVVWHLNCCNPEDNTTGGWGIFNAIFGWSNHATVGTILSYIFFWLAVIVALIYMKWQEGRVSLFGLKSNAYHRRHNRSIIPAEDPRLQAGAATEGADLEGTGKDLDNSGDASKAQDVERSHGLPVAHLNEN